jgi:hypothetical protein
MKSPLKIKPVEMTKELMIRLEDDGLIMRLAPNRHLRDTPPDDSVGTVLYESKDEYGPHRLLAVTVGRPVFSRIGSHPDHEEVWLVGDPLARPMYLLIGRLQHEEMLRKIANEGLTAEDFICLKARFNDPEVSFFVMRAGVPHDQIVSRHSPGMNPSFYVTECSRMGNRLIDAVDIVLDD